MSPIFAENAISEVKILVPAERNGGWDLTATSMAETMQALGLVDSVTIEYSPGAGGLIGLAQFISSRRGQGNALFVGGMFTVGAAAQHYSAVSLLDTSPLARLTIDKAVIAVPAGSRFKAIDDLIEAMYAAPESISWVGGSRAGVDEVNLYEIARALGIKPSRIRYSGLPGGGAVGTALVEGQYDAGISGYSEFAGLANSGRLRLLAVSTTDGMAEPVALSLEDFGIRLEHLNWRGVFAPPDLTEQQLAALSSLVEQMAQSAEWKSFLRQYQWVDAYLDGQDFIEFVEQQQDEIADDLLHLREVDPEGANVVNKVLLRRYIWAILLAAVSVLLVGGLIYQRFRARQREVGLQHAYEEVTNDMTLQAEHLTRALADIHEHIEQQFDLWNLTAAEREIAMLLLKGLRLSDIAVARGTSERTVRQQAQTVYKKAKLDGRCELAAYFIEDVMQSMQGQSDSA